MEIQKFEYLENGKSFLDEIKKHFKKATNLRKFYFLPKIHKRLSAVPGRPVISNCGTPAEKVAEYLDYILKSLMQESWFYIKDSGDLVKILVKFQRELS